MTGKNAGATTGSKLDASTLTVAVAQARFGTGITGKEAGDYLFRLAAAAAGQGAVLVLFPCYTGIFLSGHPFTASSGELDLPALVRHHGKALEERYTAWGRETARRLGIYLCPGTVILPAEGGLLHRAWLFDHRGELLGFQDQTHLSRDEASTGYLPGEQLEPFPTPWGKMGLVIGTDNYFPEVARILALRGARVLLAPHALPAPYNYWQQMSGLWPQVQQNQVFGLESLTVGEAIGKTFLGRSSIYAPCEITPGETGILYQAESENQERIGLARLDFRDLGHIQEEYPILGLMNTALYTSRLIPAYKGLKGSQAPAGASPGGKVPAEQYRGTIKRG